MEPAGAHVDVVVTNPPFGGMEEDGIESNYPADLPHQARQPTCFSSSSSTCSKTAGAAALVLPDGTLFGEVA
jgi:type I restriction enzyme M protein